MNRPILYDWPRELPRILFWSMPNQFNDLVSVRLASEESNSLNALDALGIRMANPSKKFRQLNYTIWKCRELIFSEDLVIASPDAENQQEIVAIFPKSLLNHERTIHLLQNLKLTVSQTEEVIPSELKTCLSYSLITRLTPKWNTVGELFVEGKDFLSNREPVNAIKLEIQITPEECYLVLEAYPITMPRMELEFLGVIPEMLEEFKNKESDCIQQYFIRNPWCHILPSMKKGEISSITHKIPENSVFSSYQELQHYWRNTYGYQLPEESENSVYYNVHFRMIDNHKLFTYPECCIRRSNTVIIPRIDQKPIIDSFVRDLISTMPSICGIPWQFDNQLTNPTLQLTASNQIQPQVWPPINTGPCLNKYPLKAANDQQPSGFVKAATLLNRNLSQTEIQYKQDVSVCKNLAPNVNNIITKVKVSRVLQDSNMNAVGSQKENNFMFAHKKLIQPRLGLDAENADGNLEKMAERGQLGKVKCAILTEWLQKRGFKCNKRTKKADMIKNVYKTLNILKSEQ